MQRPLVHFPQVIIVIGRWRIYPRFKLPWSPSEGVTTRPKELYMEELAFGQVHLQTKVERVTMTGSSFTAYVFTRKKVYAQQI